MEELRELPRVEALPRVPRRPLERAPALLLAQHAVAVGVEGRKEAQRQPELRVVQKVRRQLALGLGRRRGARHQLVVVHALERDRVLGRRGRRLLVERVLVALHDMLSGDAVGLLAAPVGPAEDRHLLRARRRHHRRRRRGRLPLGGLLLGPGGVGARRRHHRLHIELLRGAVVGLLLGGQRRRQPIAHVQQPLVEVDGRLAAHGARVDVGAGRGEALEGGARLDRTERRLLAHLDERVGLHGQTRQTCQQGRPRAFRGSPRGPWWICQMWHGKDATLCAMRVRRRDEFVLAEHPVGARVHLHEDVGRPLELGLGRPLEQRFAVERRVGRRHPR